MELKIKHLKWSAGLPVAMLDKKTAEKIGVDINDRITIKTISKYPKEISTIADTIQGLVSKNEIVVSSELKKRLDLRIGQKVEVNPAQTPRSLVFIKKKLHKKTLSQEEINDIIKDVVNNSLSEAEIALFVLAMYKNGMNMKETVYLINAILKTGNKLNLKNKLIADKHSIGGIPGNITTPIVVSICAAAGLTIPKTSSRAITTAAGTADVIEKIAKVDFSINELKEILKKTNACMVWGGSLGIVPADSKIIHVEKILNIDPESQLLASIMSKKLAVGSKYIIIDIPYGKGAKVSKSKAIILKKKFEKLGRYFRKKLQCILTNGREPIGNGIGPALELIDVLKVLNPKEHEQAPKDLQKKALLLAGKLLEITGKAKKDKGILLAEKILYSGGAFKKFKEIIRAQQGHLTEIKPSKLKKHILAKKSGKISEINNKDINSLARITGCPASKSSGLYLYFHVGDRVKKGGKILTIYSSSKFRLKEAINFYNDKKPIKIV